MSSDKVPPGPGLQAIVDNSDYYEPHPTVVLRRPVVLAGVIATEARRIGHRLAALHGLRFNDLQRSVEHSQGMSMAEIAERLIPHELRRLETQHLTSALAEHPKGVITVSDQALSMRHNLRLLARGSYLVALDYSVNDVYHRFRQLYPLDAPRWISEAPGPEALSSLYRQWTRRFRQAHLSLPMAGLSWEQATRELLGQLASDPSSGFAAF